MSPPERPSSIAIVGIGCMFPGDARDPASFWSHIRDGHDAIGPVPDSHWSLEDLYDADPNAEDMTYGRRGGFLSPVEFDPLAWGIAPRNLEATDTTQLLGMMVAKEALEDAGYGKDSGKTFDRERTSVILGVTGTLELVIPLGARLGHPLWRRALREAGVDDATADDVVARIRDGYVPWQENAFPGLLGNVVAGRIANRLDLHGTNCVVDAACASSLSAVHLAMLELESGRSDMVLTGGMDTFNDIFMFTCFSKTPALSPSGDCRPFDAEGDGTLLGEGLGVVVLKRLEDARRDGDRVYAVIRGLGTSSDGKGQAIYAPSSEGQARALRRAYAAADVAPSSIELVEAHGTGTRVGDATEIRALAKVYRDGLEPNHDASAQPWCALGSVKSQIGHTKAAAGVAGMIKTALALHHRTLPPTLKVSDPNPAVTEGPAPFYISTQTRPWVAPPSHPRRAALSAFGFGGSNFHCVLEEAPEDVAAAKDDWDGDTQLLAFSAATRPALADALRGFDASAAWADLRANAAALRADFSANAEHRLALALTRDHHSALPAQLTALADRLNADASDTWSTPQGALYASGPLTGDTAVIFPGQGAQYPDMLAGLACAMTAMQTTLAQAERALHARDGLRLSSLLYPPPARDDAQRDAQRAALTDTAVAQPALGAVSLGALEVLRGFGFQFDAAAGHSYGELVALCAAGSMGAEGLWEASRARGTLMANAGDGDRGTMLAALDDLEKIQALVETHSLDVVLANRNAPRQVVLSGATDAIGRAAEVLRAEGVRVAPLEVAAAFHSPLVADAAAPFADALSKLDLRAPSVPVYANTTAAPYPDDPDAIRDQLAHQLARPVEFVGLIQAMYDAGVRRFVEVGPGRRMAGLIQRILPDAPIHTASLDPSNGANPPLLDLARLLAQLAALGCPLDLTRWDAGALERHARAQAAPKPRLTVTLTGANLKPSAPPRPPRKPSAPKPAAVSAPTPAPTAPPTVAALRPAPRAVAQPPRLAPIPSPTHASPTAPQPARPTQPVHAMSQDAHRATLLGHALRLTENSLNALVRLQEHTAGMHNSFLAHQAEATRSFHALVAQQHSFIAATLNMGQGALQPIGAQPPAPYAPQPAAPAFAAPAFAAPPAPVFAPQPAPQVFAPQPAVYAQAPAPSNGALANGHAAYAAPAPVYAPTPPQPRPAPAAPVTNGHAAHGYTNGHATNGHTNGQVAYAAPAPVAPKAPAAQPPKPAPAPAAPQTSGGSDLTGVLLEVVAEKTGYPAEMLDLSMDLDADLGIDSIKRVEILSSLEERLPSMPSLPPEQLNALSTLAQIVEALGADATPSAPAPAAPAPSASTATQPSPAAGGDVTRVLLEVVAEKTGYPAEMLDLSMDLDADLGIDSIKRVEILSSLEERLPSMPSLPPERLNALSTLGQIAEALGAGEGDVNFKAASATPSEQPAPEATSAPEPLDRYVLTAAPSTLAPLPLVHALGQGALVWVSESGDALTGHVVAHLNAQGLNAQRVPAARPASAPPAQLAGLLLVAPTRGDADAWVKGAFGLLQATSPALRAQPKACLASITRLDGRLGLGALDGRCEAAFGAVAGMIKTARWEWPDVHCRALDLAPKLADAPKRLGQALDLIASPGPVEVGVEAQRAWTLTLDRVDAQPQDALRIGPSDTVVVTGGARGVTAHVAYALARASRARVVLLGRTPLGDPPPADLADLTDPIALKRALFARTQGLTPRQLQAEADRILRENTIRGTLNRIASTGARVDYHAVDVRDASAVHALFDRIGPVHALIHGAGVLADRAIEDKTDADFAKVYDTKVTGLRNMLRAQKRAPLKALVVFSSSTGRFGRRGQIDYAAANEALNKLAQHAQRRAPLCRVLSLGWGPWDGGMVTPALKALFDREGVATIGLESGAEALLDELRQPNGPVELVLLGRGSDLPEEVLAPSAQPAASQPDAEVFVYTLDPDRDAALSAHVVGGRALLPMALTLEWMTHAAIHANPGLQVQGVDDLAMRAPVACAPGERVRVSITAAPARRDGTESFVDVALRIGRDPNALVCATATVVLTEALAEAPQAPQAPSDLTEPLSDPAPLYQGPLFHRHLLQGIKAWHGASPQGATADLHPSSPPRDWLDASPRRRWLTDPLAVDVGLQTLLVWAAQQHGATVLPTTIAQYRQYTRRIPSEGLRVVATVTRPSAHHPRLDLTWIDAQDNVVAQAIGCEAIANPKLKAQFRANVLT